jgi:hypothetical protein
LLPGSTTEASTFNEVYALWMRRKLQGAPPPDVEAVRRHLKYFTPPKEGLLMRVRLARRKADVFKPRPGSRAEFKARLKTEREIVQQKNDTIRHACLHIAEDAVAARCYVSLELPLPDGLSIDEAIVERGLYRRRIREREGRAGEDTTMFVTVRAKDGKPTGLSVLCNKSLEDLETLIDCGRLKSVTRSHGPRRRGGCARLLQRFGRVNGDRATEKSPLSAVQR